MAYPTVAPFFLFIKKPSTNDAPGKLPFVYKHLNSIIWKTKFDYPERENRGGWR